MSGAERGLDHGLDHGPSGAAPARRRAHVVGLGLIGTSLALALGDAGWVVSGEDLLSARVETALALGSIACSAPVGDAQLAIVATPVAAIAPTVKRLFAESGNPDLVVTDVGGVKAAVVAAIDEARFVGGHPMAGSEQEGPAGADRDLFVGASWVLTPTARTDTDALQLVRSVVAELGAEVVSLAPDKHDALVAVVSHVPHLAAANLMALAADASEEHGALLRLAAGGFRDMTRIAAGDPAIWPDIFEDNAEAVLSVLDSLRARLDEARRIVAEGDRPALSALLERATRARRNLPARVARPESLVELRIAVPDRPGVLAEVTTVLGGLGVNIWDLEIAHSAEGERGVLVCSIDGEGADKARAALAERGYRPSLRALS